MNLTRDEKDFLFQKGVSLADAESFLPAYRKGRLHGIPHAYLVGKVEFYDLNITVSEDCLIPRLESEILVEKALLLISEKDSVLDLCCGSGALGLSVKKKRPGAMVTLSDVSEKALEISRCNARDNDLDVEVVQGDFLKALKGRIFDVIICNPPYISMEEFKCLDSSVKDFEPELALVGGDDGLLFYKELAVKAGGYLAQAGRLCLEIGKDQGSDILELFSGPTWCDARVEKDYSSHDRFFFVKKAEG